VLVDGIGPGAVDPVILEYLHRDVLIHKPRRGCSLFHQGLATPLGRAQQLGQPGVRDEGEQRLPVVAVAAGGRLEQAPMVPGDVRRQGARRWLVRRNDDLARPGRELDAGE
jgi:hypothetical protein